MKWHKFGERKPRDLQRVIVKRGAKNIDLEFPKFVWEIYRCVHPFERDHKFNPSYYEWKSINTVDLSFECKDIDYWLDPDEVD